jgi:hypothetical protein
MKKLILLIFATTLLILAACGSKPSLEGIWERKDTSSYSGMQVEVVKLKDGTFRGTIVKQKGDVFKDGDVKWNKITNTNENNFDVDDLGTDGWYKMIMSLSNDGKSLLLKNFVDTGEEGSKQAWTKIR